MPYYSGQEQPGDSLRSHTGTNAGQRRERTDRNNIEKRHNQMPIHVYHGNVRVHTQAPGKAEVSFRRWARTRNKQKQGRPVAHSTQGQYRTIGSRQGE